MAILTLTRGDKWRWLECLAIEEKTIQVPWPRGGGSDPEDIVTIKLKCRCGKTIVIKKENFPGKRRMQDCGCGNAEREGDTSNIAIVLPTELKHRVKSYANMHEGGNFSLAVANILRAELDRLGWYKTGGSVAVPILVDSQMAK